MRATALVFLLALTGSCNGQAPPAPAPTPAPSVPTWMGAYQASIGSYGSAGIAPNTVTFSETVPGNPNSLAGVVGAARTSDFPSGAVGDTALGLFGFGLSNNSSLGGGSGSWSLYTECHREATGPGSICLASELEARNNAPGEFQPDPFQPSYTMGTGIGCGAGVASTGYPCGAAAIIRANPETWNAGIVFLNGGLTTVSLWGAQASKAITLPPNYAVVWYSAVGTPVAAISADSAGNLELVGTSLLFNGKPITVP